MTAILMVDDEWAQWEVPMTLKFAGYQLIFEGSPRQVLQLIKENPQISAVLLDLHFPEEALQGPEVLELIKGYNSDIPVFVLTARDETNLALKLLNKGRGPAADYFVKEDLRSDFANEVKVHADRYAADCAVATTGIKFSDRERRVHIGEVSFELENLDYALYRTIAQAAKDQWIGVGPCGVGPEHRGWIAMSDFYRSTNRASQALVQNYENTFGLGTDRTDDLRDAMSKEPEEIRSRISPSRNRIKKELEARLTQPKLLEKFRIHEELRTRPIRVSTFGLRVAPDQILIDPS